MKIEVELGIRTVEYEGDSLTWEFIDGRVEIFAGTERLATYRLDQVLWVKRK